MRRFYNSLLRQLASLKYGMPHPEPRQLDLFSQDFPASGALKTPETLQPIAPDAKSKPTIEAGALLPTAAPPHPVIASPKRRVQVENISLDYALRRSKRRSIGFLIDDDGLRVTAPKWTTIGQIEKAIREKQRWIFTKLHEQRERSVRRLQPKMHWADGGTLPYLGSDITLRIRATQSVGIVYDETTRELIVCLPQKAAEQQLKDRVQGWLQLEAKRLFAERLPLYAEKLGVTYQSFTLSSASTQWGSCTADGKIRLNWRLVHFALPLIDYVIAHELSHLREMNHSPRFWATVQSIFPEFETAKKTLRGSLQDTLPIF